MRKSAKNPYATADSVFRLAHNSTHDSLQRVYVYDVTLLHTPNMVELVGLYMSQSPYVLSIKWQRGKLMHVNQSTRQMENSQKTRSRKPATAY